MAQLDSATYARFLEKSISKSRVPISHASFKWQIAAIDISAVVASCFAGGFAYHLIAVPNFIPDVGILAGTCILAATFYVLVARAFGLYDFQCLLDSGPCMTRVLGGWALSVLLLSLVLFLLKVGASSSRGAVVTFAVLGGLSLAVSRTIAATLLRRSVRHGTLTGRRAVVAGDPADCTR